jgi:hypothetical protein
MAEKKDYSVDQDTAPRADSDEFQTGADALALHTDDPVYDAKARVLNRAVSIDIE